MKVENMISSRSGNKVANQFIVSGDNGKRYFQSYDTIIAVIENGEVTLDESKWNYSNTTSRYRSQFLGENTAETKKKINAEIYKMAELN
jgi:hypothetical protein